MPQFNKLTNSGWRKVRQQVRGDWSCPNCSARNKYYWLRCPNCAQQRESEE